MSKSGDENILKCLTEFYSKNIIGPDNLYDLVKVDNFVKLLSKSFKQYLEQNCNLHKIKEPDFLLLEDKFQNTPLHFLSLFDNLSLVELVRNNELSTHFAKTIVKKNKDKFTPISCSRSDEMKKLFLSEIDRTKYDIPQITLEVNLKKSQSSGTLNSLIKILNKEGLDIVLVESVQEDKLFILIFIPFYVFLKDAVELEIKCKLIGRNEQRTIEDNVEFLNSIEPIYSRIFQEVVDRKIHNLLDINFLVDQDVITKLFFAHKLFCKQPVRYQQHKRRVECTELVFISTFHFLQENANRRGEPYFQ